MARWRRWPLPGALVALVLVAGCTVRLRPQSEPGPPVAGALGKDPGSAPQLRWTATRGC